MLSCCPNNRPPKSLIWAVGRGGSIDGGRISKPYTGDIEGGTHHDHSGTLVAVVRAVSVPRSQPRRLRATRSKRVAAGSNLDGKASVARSHFEPLGTRSRPLLGTSEPSAQPHRSKWHHGCPAESVMLTSCRLLQPKHAARPRDKIDKTQKRP